MKYNSDNYPYLEPIGNLYEPPVKIEIFGIRFLYCILVGYSLLLLFSMLLFSMLKYNKGESTCLFLFCYLPLVWFC